MPRKKQVEEIVEAPEEQVEVEVAEVTLCEACSGKGVNPEDYAQYCAECKGSGQA